MFSWGQRENQDVIMTRNTSANSNEFPPTRSADVVGQPYLLSCDQPISGRFPHSVHADGGYAQHRRDGHYHHLAYNKSTCKR